MIFWPRIQIKLSYHEFVIEGFYNYYNRCCNYRITRWGSPKVQRVLNRLQTAAGFMKPKFTDSDKCLVSEPSETSIIVLWGGSRRALIRIKSGTLRISLCLRGVGSFSVAIFHLDARHDRFLLFFSFEVKPDQIFPGKAKVNHLFSHPNPNFECIRPSQVRTKRRIEEKGTFNHIYPPLIFGCASSIWWRPSNHVNWFLYNSKLTSLSAPGTSSTKHIQHPIRPGCLVTGATQMVFPSHDGYLH